MYYAAELELSVVVAVVGKRRTRPVAVAGSCAAVQSIRAYNAVQTSGTELASSMDKVWTRLVAAVFGVVVVAAAVDGSAAVVVAGVDAVDGMMPLHFLQNKLQV